MKNNIATTEKNFARLFKQVKEGDQTAMNDFLASTVDFIESLKKMAQTKNYNRTYETHNHRYTGDQIVEAEQFTARQENFSYNQSFHRVDITQRPESFMYALSDQFIISTNGKFMFRPKEKILTMNGIEVELKDHEVNRLLAYLVKDFGLRSSILKNKIKLSPKKKEKK